MRFAFPPSRVVVLALGIAGALQLVLVNAWPRFASPNERGRVYQAIAFVHRGELAIGPELERFGAMEDVAVARGRSFPNKAPGMLPLLVPGALAARAIAGGSPAELAWASVLGRLLAASLPFLLALVMVARTTLPRWPRGGAFAVATLALASPLLAASLLAFSHALAACLLLAAFLLLHGERAPTPRSAALAGLALAGAVACEYTLAVPGVVIVLAAIRRLTWASAGTLVLGGVVGLLPLLAYHAHCFGSPFALPQAFEVNERFVALRKTGLFGIGTPSPAAIAGQLLSAARGLLVFCPFLGLLLVPARADERGRAVDWTGAVSLAALVVLMSGFADWHGGWFPGPRYLLPALPLVAIPLARGAEGALARTAGRVLAAGAALWGAVMLWPCLATFPFPPEDFPLPAFTLAWPLLADAGTLAPSWLPRLVLGPILAVLAGVAAGTLVISATPGGRWVERATASLFVALAVTLAGALARPADTWKAALEAAVIHDVYTASTPAGALEALRPRADTEGRRAQLERWIAARDATAR